MTATLKPKPLSSVLEADEQVDFTSGDCWALAEELGKLGNLPLYIVSVTNFETPDTIDWEQIYWCHVVARIGDLYLDAHGLSTESELLLRWLEYGDLVRVPSQVAFNDLTAWFSLQFRSREETRDAAERLLTAAWESGIPVECSEIPATF